MSISNPGFIDDIRSKNDELATLVDRCIGVEPDHYHVLLQVIQSRILPYDKTCKIWSDNLGIAWVDLKSTLFQPDVVDLLPRETAIEVGAIPLYQMGDVVTVAMVDPKSVQLVDRLAKNIGHKISPVFALMDEIRDAVEVQYHSVEELENLYADMELVSSSLGKEISKADLEKTSGKKAIIEFARGLLLLAVKENASDIHIEPYEYHVHVRFRIDGVLNHRFTFASDVLAPLLSRYKVMGKMNITERRRPQGGRIVLNFKTKTINLRVSTVPTVYGEKMVLRILGQILKKNIPILESLHLSKKIYTWAKELIYNPNGSFFITGPTGSGKTTTLFSALQKINTPEKNIMTIEDPVEYRLPGINQVQVEHEIGVNFPSVLRAFLRQDPDIILIGEIRDLETAQIATQASLTGHLVFATLHTNDAIQAVTRLVEIGVDPFLVGPSLIGVMSQRLVRCLCENCKESYVLDEAQMDHLFEHDGSQSLMLYRAKGCQRCRFTGFNGRLAIHEMIMVSNELRVLVTENAPVEKLRKTARESGYMSMHYDGIKKAIRGLTSLEEVERVCPHF